MLAPNWQLVLDHGVHVVPGTRGVRGALPFDSFIEGNGKDSVN